MTEKILKDGVDVAGCCLFTGGNCMQRMVDKNIIDDDVTCNGICDYGALYRKEYIIKPLERERDELKQENKQMREKFKQIFDIDRQECWDIAYINDERAKYKAVLKEIKDYCEKCKKCVETGDEVILYTVIKKVNEVLNENKQD